MKSDFNLIIFQKTTMSQTTITSYFNSRKRHATEDIVSSKSKIAHISDASLTFKRAFRKDSNIEEEPSSKSYEVKVDLKKSEKTLLTPVEFEVQEKNGAAFAKKNNAANSRNQEGGPSKSESLNSLKSARKELSLGDLKKKLAGSSRLAELRASADRISKGIQELKEKTEKKNLKEFKSIDVEVPLSPSKRSIIQNEVSTPKSNSNKHTKNNIEKTLISPRKVVVSPVKSPNKVPAYIRHASLATSSTSLPLPHQYRFLAEVFRGIETVVALLYNRNETITFSKLKPSVQEMLKRNFTEKHLAQIKNLVPDFYNFEIKHIKNFSASSHKESYEMIISPNFPSEYKVMNPSVLLERRRYFYGVLLQLVKKHHAQYLLTLDPPLVIPEDKLTRWHPEFELERVPDVECARLPQAPNVEKFSTAQDVLARARELFKCNTKMERAMEKLAQARALSETNEGKSTTGLTDFNQNKQNNVTTQTVLPSVSEVTILNPALRNLPASLLEKVKAKQAAKALEAMTRSSENEKKYLVYSRLPDLARTLRNIFVTERKNVLALNIILSKLESSFKSNISANDLQRDIKMLAEEVPEWIKLHEIRNNTYLKLDKNADLKTIVAKLEALAEKYKNN